MRVILLLLLFLYTLIPSTLYLLVEKYNLYFYISDVRSTDKGFSFKGISFGFTNLLGRNLSVYAKELILGKTVSIKSLYINLIDLRRKPKKKEPFILKAYP